LAHAVDVVTQRGGENITARILPFLSPLPLGGTRSLADLLNAELRGLVEDPTGTQGESSASAGVSTRRIKGYLKLAGGNPDAPGFGFDKDSARKLLDLQRGYRLAAKTNSPAGSLSRKLAEFQIREIDRVVNGLDNPTLSRTDREMEFLRSIESFAGE
jgi:hypothetical protein